MMAGQHNVSDADLEHFMETILELVKETGEIIANAIGTSGNMEIDEKEQNIGEGNASAILTETDLKVEKHLINGLKSKYPDHQFIGEESTGDSGPELGDSPTWIIDPIDGTMNFVHSNPLVCTSVGLTVNKKLVLGVVHCPLIDKVYTAIKGKGAFCNGKSIKTSGVKDIGKAMMIMELPAGANKEKKDIAMENLKYMMDNAHAIRCPGPAAMDIAWIGAGSADAYFHQGIHSWDMAGGTIIVKEAGGTVLGTDGGEFDLMSRGVIVAASNELASQVVKFIKLYPSPRDQFTPVHPL